MLVTSEQNEVYRKSARCKTGYSLLAAAADFEDTGATPNRVYSASDYLTARNTIILLMVSRNPQCTGPFTDLTLDIDQQALDDEPVIDSEDRRTLAILRHKTSRKQGESDITLQPYQLRLVRGYLYMRRCVGFATPFFCSHLGDQMNDSRSSKVVKFEWIRSGVRNETMSNTLLRV
jgi:hypothetical protein